MITVKSLMAREFNNYYVTFQKGASMFLMDVNNDKVSKQMVRWCFGTS